MTTSVVKSTVLVNQLRYRCDNPGCIKGATVSIPAPGRVEAEAETYADAVQGRQGWTRSGDQDFCPDHS